MVYHRKIRLTQLWFELSWVVAIWYIINLLNISTTNCKLQTCQKMIAIWSVFLLWIKNLKCILHLITIYCIWVNSEGVTCIWHYSVSIGFSFSLAIGLSRGGKRDGRQEGASQKVFEAEGFQANNTRHRENLLKHVKI